MRHARVMARLIGMIANRPDLCTRFAEFEGRSLGVTRADDEWGWGVGFFQSGDILLKRRPIDERTTIDTGYLMADLRSDLMIAQVRQGTVGSAQTDNTHPFRYRQWMFACTGTVAGADSQETVARLQESLPDFLQRSVRGETDSEAFFHLFLSFLHDNGELHRESVAPDAIFSAMQSALGLLDRMADGAPSRLNILIATPEHLVAVCRGAKMGYRLLVGREDFEPMFSMSGATKLTMPDLEPCRLCAVASDFRDSELPTGWTEVASGSMVAFSRTGEPLVHPR